MPPKPRDTTRHRIGAALASGVKISNDVYIIFDNLDANPCNTCVLGASCKIKIYSKYMLKLSLKLT